MARMILQISLLNECQRTTPKDGMLSKVRASETDAEACGRATYEAVKGILNVLGLALKSTEV